MNGKKWIFWASIAIWVFLGFIYVIAVHGEGLVYPDEKEYDILARHLVEKETYSFDGITPTAARPPGMPLFISAIYKMGGNAQIVLIIQYVLLGIALWWVAEMYHEYVAKWNHWEVALLAFCPVFYPVIFYTAGTLYPQIIAAFLIIFILKILQTELNFFKTFVIGLSGGFLILCSPNYYFIFIGIFAYLFFLLKKKAIRNILIISLGAGVVMIPWFVRNYNEFNRFIPISTNGGFNLLLGNNSFVKEDTGVNVDFEKICTQQEKSELNDYDLDVFYRQKAVTWIKKHPMDATVFYFKKVLNHFSCWNQFATANAATSRNALILKATYLTMMGLVILRLIQIRRSPLGRMEMISLILNIGAALFLAIFTTRIRYRLPFDLLLFPVAVHGFHLLRVRFFKPSS